DWLATIHQGKENALLEHQIVLSIMQHVKDYVSLDDPMGLNTFYEGGTLNSIGLMKANLTYLRNADDIFANKKDYQKLVAEFGQWRDNEKNKIWVRDKNTLQLKEVDKGN